MISSRYLMPVSVPSAITSAVLPRDEMPHHDTTSAKWTSVNHTTFMETFTNTTVNSKMAIAVVEIEPGLIRERITCPVLLGEVYVSSTPGKPCYTMTLLQNRTSWTYALFTQSITYRLGTDSSKTRNTSSRQRSSSESFTEMNHPDVRILANRSYVWTS